MNALPKYPVLETSPDPESRLIPFRSWLLFYSVLAFFLCYLFPCFPVKDDTVPLFYAYGNSGGALPLVVLAHVAAAVLVGTVLAVIHVRLRRRLRVTHDQDSPPPQAESQPPRAPSCQL